MPTNQWNNFSDSILSIFKNDYDSIYFEDGFLQAIKNDSIRQKDGSYKKYPHHSILHVTSSANGLADKRLGKKALGIQSHDEFLVFNNRTEKVLDLTGIGGNCISFAELSDSLVELHLPFTSPNDVEIIRLPPYLHKNITLYVPWHCKDVYLNNAYYGDFREIKEDSFAKRFLSIFGFYIDNILFFLQKNVLLTSLLFILILGVVYTGCRKIVSNIKKKGVPNNEIRRKTVFTTIKMLFGATVGFIVFYWFGWIVLFDSIGNMSAYMTSITFGVIGTFLLPWIWIFSEELDYKKLKLTLKTVPTTISAWIKTMLYLSFNGIKKANKHWKTIMPIIFALILILICIDKIQTKNNQIRDRIEQWETGNEQERDSVLLELVSLYPDIQSVFCPEELTIKYDSIIDYAYDELVKDGSLAFSADTIIKNNVSWHFDVSKKLVYLLSSPLTRYDIAADRIDTLSIPESLIDYRYIDPKVYNINGFQYYIRQGRQETIELHKVNDKDCSFVDSIVCTLPKTKDIKIGITEICIAEDEKKVVIYDDYLGDFIQCWDIEKGAKLYESLNVEPSACCLDNEVLYYFDKKEKSIVTVSLTDYASNKFPIPAKEIMRINISEDGSLLLIDGWMGEVGNLNAKTHKYSRLFLKHFNNIMDYDGNLYLQNDNCLLRYNPINMTISSKIEKIKKCLLNYK